MIDYFDLVVIFELFDYLCIDCDVVNFFDVVVCDGLLVCDDCECFEYCV